MRILSQDELKMLRAQVFDLGEHGAKQALFTMIEVLEDHPSILAGVFRVLIEDATALTRLRDYSSRFREPVRSREGQL